MTGPRGLSADVGARVEALAEATAGTDRYRGWAETETLIDRLAAAATWLDGQALDGEAIFLVASGIHYLGARRWDQLWRNASAELSTTVAADGFTLADCRFVQAPGESHVERLVRHIELRRHEVTAVPDADNLLASCLARFPALDAHRDLALFDERPVWIAVWDWNLSGKTMGTQLRRFRECQHVMPTARERRLFAVSPVIAERAREAITARCPDAHVVSALEIQPGFAALSPDEASRARALVEAFYERFVRPCVGDQDERYRNVGPYGYADSFCLVVAPDNCPNNTPPLLWAEVAGYPAPFPRSAAGHRPTDLSAYTDEDLAAAAARLALRLGVRRQHATARAQFGQPDEYWDWCTSQCFAAPGGPDARPAAELLLEWIPADTAKRKFLRGLLEIVRAEVSGATTVRLPALVELYQDLVRVLPHNDHRREAALQRLQPLFVGLLPTVVPAAAAAKRPLFGPVPATRVHDGVVEPLSTRAGEVQGVVERLAQAALILVDGVPGWGKSWFCDRVAVESGLAVRIVNGAQCPRDHVLAQRLVEDLSLSDAESERIDADPAAAVDVLLAHSDNRGLLYIEDVDANEELRPPDGLERMARRLVDRGIPVVVESRGRIHPQVLGDLHVRRVQLARIGADEVREWARRLGIALTPELDVLELFDGHPGLVRAALQALAERRATAASVLSLAVDTDEFRQRSTSTPDMSRWVVTRLALTPWVPLCATEVAALGVEGGALAAFGLLVATAEGSWRPTAWARAVALRRLLREEVEPVDLAEVVFDGLGHIELARAIEHLDGLIVRGRPLQVVKIAERLRRRLDEAELPLGHYVAPPPPVEADAAQTTSSLLAQLDRTARLRGSLDADLVERLVRSPDLWDVVTATWTQAKALFYVVTRGVARAHDKTAIWLHLLEPFRAGVTNVAWATSGSVHVRDGTRNWLARVAARGARALRRRERWDASAEWLAVARALLPVAPPDDASVRSFHDDTVYLVASVEVVAARSPRERLEAAMRALAAVPPSERWLPQWYDHWAEIEVDHLYTLWSFDGGAPIEDRIVARFRAWPMSSAWVRRYEQFRSHRTSLEFRRALASALNGARAAPHVDPRLGRLSAVLGAGKPAFEMVLALIEGSASLRDDIDRVVVETALDRLESVVRPVGHRRELYDTLQRVFEWLLANWAPTWEDRRGDTRLLLRLLRALHEHEVDAGNGTGDDMARLRSVHGRVDGRFHRVIESTDVSALYLDWAEHRVWALRVHARVDRSMKDSRNPRVDAKLSAWLQGNLADLARWLEDERGDEPAARIAAARLHLYLWNMRKAWELVRGTSTSALYESQFLKAARVCHAVCGVVMQPAWTRAGEFTDAEADEARERFATLVDAVAGGTGSRKERVWCEQMALLARRPDSEFWEEFLRANRARVGSPTEYWSRVVEPPTERVSAPVLQIQDLTDEALLDTAAEVARRGALEDRLPVTLRFQLAELGAALAIDAATWRRGSHRGAGSPPMGLLDQWRCGLTIGVALSLSEDGRLFGTRVARVKEDGTKISWWGRCNDDLTRTSDIAPDAWAMHASRLRNELKARIPPHHRQPLIE